MILEQIDSILDDAQQVLEAVQHDAPHDHWWMEVTEDSVQQQQRIVTFLQELKSKVRTGNGISAIAITEILPR